MHSLLAHAYHLAMHPVWRAPVAAFMVALIVRLARRPSAPFAAGLAALAGWLAVQYPDLTASPVKPLDRLPGLAAILLAYLWLAPGAGKRFAVLALPALSLAASWWIAGAPLSGPGIAACVPVFLGTWAALALSRKFAGPGDTGRADTGRADTGRADTGRAHKGRAHKGRADTGRTDKSRAGNEWAGIGAALALACAILLAGGSPHWARAAAVPAWAGLALIGVPEATLPLAFATALTACLTVLASDRGRFAPVDLAVVAPLLVWFLALRLLPRLNRAGPMLAALVATLGGIGLTVAAIRLLAVR